VALSLADLARHLLAALAAGALIGTERSFHGRAAGFRTHTLVSLASSMLMLVTLSQPQWLGQSETIRMDPTRMAQGIMTGIGFLGAGVIFKEGLSIRGLTTAASIWTTAAIGVLMGVGLYAAGALSTLLTLGILSVFRQVEMRFPSHLYARNVLRFRRDEAPPEAELRAMLARHGFTVSGLAYDLADEGETFQYRMYLRTVDPENVSRLAAALKALPALRGFELSPSND
jgi:putative Mg2+ transporter-C (MgtC) family protein